MIRSIQNRIIFLIGLIGAGMVVGVLFAERSRDREMKSIFQEEKTEDSLTVYRVLDFRAKSLGTFVLDITCWDQLVDFTRTGNVAWADGNLKASFETIGINYAWIFGADNSLLYSAFSGKDIGEQSFPLNATELAGLMKTDSLHGFYFQAGSSCIEVVGAAIHPTSDNRRITPSSGYLFLGKVWNRDFLHEIEGQTDSGLDILDPVAVPKPEDSVNLLDFKVVTFKMLPGWNGSPAAYLRSSRVIDSAVQYRKASWEDQLIHIVIVFVFLIGVAMILIRIINRPVKNMVLSLLSEDPEPISRLRSQKTEFGQIARLMSEFFIQKKKLVREIEENLKIEKELTLAKDRAEESDRLKTTFLNNLSHEIRTPMNAIVGFSELIGDPDISEEEKKQFTGIIRDNTFRLLSTITDLVTLSKIETGQEPVIREEFNLNELLNGLFREIKEEINGKPVALNLIVPVENSSPNILTDRRKLITILRNLLVNSVKFTNSGKIDFGYSWQDGELRFFVRDTGIGIPAGKFEDIFARFQQADDSLTRQVGGAGLGLPISRAYAELLGGQMWVTSEVGKGSEFFFTITNIS